MNAGHGRQRVVDIHPKFVYVCNSMKLKVFEDIPKTVYLFQLENDKSMSQ